ncbi:MAG: endo-1,4-beta-xylanase [Patescibacteria group bacterium]
MINKTLKELAQAKNLYIGAAVLPNLLKKDSKYAETLSSEFNMVGTESCMKWRTIHPVMDKYTFDEADELMEFTLKNKMTFRGHTLVYSRKMPEWFNDIKDKKIMEEQLEEHIKTVVGRYKGKIYAWDVINEEFDFDNNHQQSPLFKMLGISHIEKAFRWAHEADPDLKLFVNEFGIEEINKRSDLTYDMIIALLKNKVPVHGIGFQMHRALGNGGEWLNKLPDMESMRKNFQRFADLGLEIHITEMDIPIQKGTGSYEDKLIEQARAYKEILEVAFSIRNFKALVVWGVTDLYNWIDLIGQSKDAPLLFDMEYKKKPAYFEVQKLLQD